MRPHYLAGSVAHTIQTSDTVPCWQVTSGYRRNRNSRTHLSFYRCFQLARMTELRHRSARMRAALLVNSGEVLARRALAEDLASSEGGVSSQIETQDDVWRILGREPIRVAEDSEIRISIRDSGSRIAINGLRNEY